MNYQWPEWYTIWAALHLKTFAIVSKDNMQTLELWWPAFRSMGVEEQELHNATQRVLSCQDAPMRVADHYSAIKVSIANDRIDRLRRSEAAQMATGPDYSKCADCGNSGWVVVPHPKHCDAFEWRPHRYSGQGDAIHATASVLCSRCNIGKTFIARQANNEDTPREKAMVLEWYENHVNGNWREQIKDLQDQKATIRDVEANNAARDTTSVIRTFAETAGRV